MNIMEKMGLMVFMIGLVSLGVGSGEKIISYILCVGGCFIFIVFEKGREK